jgi:hypothetical protein
MIGPHQFKPQASGAQYSVLAQGVQTNTAGYVTAIVNLPIGSVITAMWCQAYDSSAAKNINVNLAEVNTDANGGGAQRAILAANTAGQPGHVQIATSQVFGNNVIRSFESAAPGGADRFYSYTLNAFLDGTTSTGMKGCAIQYQ